MSMLARLAIALALAGPIVATAQEAEAQRRRDGAAAFRARRGGRVIPPRQIERRVVPTMPRAEYLGFDYDFPREVYTLKFVRDGRVIWVAVDGRTGAVLGRTGR
jgi:hypothetical protein